MSIPPNRNISGRDDAAAPVRAAIKITKANTPLTNGPCRGFWVGTAGTLNAVDFQGNTLTNFPAKEGLNPISLRQISTGGTADDIWVLY